MLSLPSRLCCLIVVQAQTVLTEQKASLKAESDIMVGKHRLFQGLVGLCNLAKSNYIPQNSTRPLKCRNWQDQFKVKKKLFFFP